MNKTFLVKVKKILFKNIQKVLKHFLIWRGALKKSSLTKSKDRNKKYYDWTRASEGCRFMQAHRGMIKKWWGQTSPLCFSWTADVKWFSCMQLTDVPQADSENQVSDQKEGNQRVF